MQIQKSEWQILSGTYSSPVSSTFSHRCSLSRICHKIRNPTFIEKKSKNTRTYKYTAPKRREHITKMSSNLSKQDLKGSCNNSYTFILQPKSPHALENDLILKLLCHGATLFVFISWVPFLTLHIFWLLCRHTAFFLVAGDEMKNQNQQIQCKHGIQQPAAP